MHCNFIVIYISLLASLSDVITDVCTLVISTINIASMNYDDTIVVIQLEVTLIFI